jgi:hypothetical protein
MMRWTQRGVASVLLLLLGGPVCAEPGWTLQREQGGVTLWSRPNPPGPFQALKLEMQVQARPAALLAVLRDTNRHKLWLPGSREVRLLSHPGPDEDLVYTRLAAPWPAKDRELITHSRLSWLSGCGFTLRVWAEPDALPPTKGLVRIRASHGVWQADPLGKGGSLIRLETYTHPGGRLPGWLVNQVASTSAFDSFTAIKGLMQQTKKPTIDLYEADCTESR